MAKSSIRKVVSSVEQNAYQRGYRAGRNSAQLRTKNSLYNFRREGFRKQVFLSALNGLLANGKAWGSGDKIYQTSEDFCHLAWLIADRAILQAHFTGEIFAAGQVDG